jgi:two-component system NtrC family sensor kinase
VGRLSLRARILGAFLLSFLSFCGALGFGLAQLDSIGDGLNVVDRGYLPLAKIIGQVETTQSRLELDLERLEDSRPRLLTGQSSVSIVSAAKLSERIQEGLLIISTVLPIVSDTEEKATLAALNGQFLRIQSAHLGQQEVVQTFLIRTEAGEAQLALAIKPKLLEAQSELHTEIEQISIRIMSATQRVSDRTASAQRRAMLVSGFLALIALAFGSLMLVLAMISLRPIAKLTAEVQRIARGETGARVEVQRRDEIGLLADEINQMAAAIELRDEALRTQAHTERLALVGQMLAQITHEVRNPLNALSLNAELLAEEVTRLPEERQLEALDIVQIMSSEIRNLEEVTEHYLSLVRRPAPLPGKHNPSVVVQGVAKLLQEELKRSNVQLLVEGNIQESIEIDEGHLRRALLNVVRNAMEAKAETVRIQIRLFEHTLEITVEDDGEGMSPEQIARASEPFFSTKAAGTGLGLAITRQILEDHGGGLSIEAMDTGTRVRLTLPA